MNAFHRCWMWCGTVRNDGYGAAPSGKSGRHVLAHRKMYECLFGPIPKGMHALHMCDVRLCVNPWHIFLGTNQDNIADRVRKNRSTRLSIKMKACRAGHLRSKTNSYFRPFIARNGKEYMRVICKVCKKESRART